MDNRPRGREKNITGQGKEIQKHGSGLNSRPVGRSEGYEGRPQSPNGQQGQQFRTENPNARRQTTTRAGGRGGFLIVVIIVALVLFGGKGLMNGLTGGCQTFFAASAAMSSGSTASFCNVRKSAESRLPSRAAPDSRCKVTPLRRRIPRIA